MNEITKIKGTILIDCQKVIKKIILKLINNNKNSYSQDEIIKRVIERKKVENRIDDDLSILDKRINGYIRDTKPIIQKLNEISDLLVIKGSDDIKTVNRNIIKKLKYLI